MEPVFPADVKTRCFHFLPQQLRIWSFLLSSVSWQSRFLQFFLKAGLSPVTYRSFKSIVIVSFCFSNNLPISGLQQHVFISLHFCSLHVQQGSPWAWIKASAGLHHFCGSGGESISCLFNLLDKKKKKVSPTVVSDSLRSHGLYPALPLCPWNSQASRNCLHPLVHSLLHPLSDQQCYRPPDIIQSHISLSRQS